MKSFSKALKIGAAPLAMFVAAQSPALAQTFDWSGAYVGGLVGMHHSASDGSVGYTNDGAAPPEGWVNGEFHGDVYNTLDSLTVSSSFESAYDSPMPDLTDWLTSFSHEESDFVGTVLVGGAMQNGNIVFGGELRATFGSFGASDSNSWTNGGQNTGSVGADYEGTNDFAYEQYSPVDGIGLLNGLQNVSGAIAYTGEYTQDTTQEFDTEYNALITPMAKVGVAVDRVQFFAMAGPAYAHVESNTSATIVETGSGTTTYEGPADPFTVGGRTYNFSGSNSKHMWGYSLGGGAEWAATDNVIIRVEGEFHDLGSISVTGKSPDTSATYTVKQDLSGYGVSTGVILKF